MLITSKYQAKGGDVMQMPKVLLVDDEVPFVETMKKRLEKRNLNICLLYTSPSPRD